MRYDKQFDEQRRMLSGIYALMGKINTPMPMNYKEVASAIGVQPSKFIDLKFALERFGILQTRRGYDLARHKRIQDWILLVPEERAKELLKDYHRQVEAGTMRYMTSSATPGANQHNPDWTSVEAPAPQINVERVERAEMNGHTPEPVALAPAKSEEETRAIAGPDRPSPFAPLRVIRRDESRALVEAARQYRDRARFVAEELVKFREMGISIDASAISFSHDEALEAVSHALPYIESVERENANLSKLVSQETRKDIDEAKLRREMEALRRLNEGLLRENTGLKNEIHNRASA